MSTTWWAPGILVPAALTVAGLLAGLVVRRLLLSYLGRLAARTSTTLDDLALEALRGPVVVWGALLGLHLAAQAGDLPPGLARLVPPVLLTLLIGSITWVAARLAGDGVAGSMARHGLFPSATLVPRAVSAAVLVLGALVILQTLGVSISPLLTALGVGGLAVALALQDTLSNLFAGIQILASRQVRPGDFVRLETGEDGFVEDVTWRNTTIRRLANNLVVVPNAKLASAVTTNFSLPALEMSVVVPVGVAYGSDLEHVERVTVEVAREVLREVEGGVPTFEPSIRYTAFADSSIRFHTVLRSRDFVAQFLLTHEFIKRLHVRYAAEGIRIPFPTRTVQLQAPGA
jgi:small-conductance mechanosensitive channel